MMTYIFDYSKLTISDLYMLLTWSNLSDLFPVLYQCALFDIGSVRVTDILSMERQFAEGLYVYAQGLQGQVRDVWNDANVPDALRILQKALG